MKDKCTVNCILTSKNFDYVHILTSCDCSLPLYKYLTVARGVQEVWSFDQEWSRIWSCLSFISTISWSAASIYIFPVIFLICIEIKIIFYKSARSELISSILVTVCHSFFRNNIAWYVHLSHLHFSTYYIQVHHGITKISCELEYFCINEVRQKNVSPENGCTWRNSGSSRVAIPVFVF